MKPLVVGLTGSIGCGKSTVLRILVALGALGIDADQVAHDVMMPGGLAYDAVVAEFGAELLSPDGQIDRARLGVRVFAEPALLARLEQVVHPAVGEVIREQVAHATEPMVVIEAIKLLEAGLSRRLCDEVWVVTCSREQQVARLAASRGMSADEVDRRWAAQMPQEQMAAQADLLIDSDGTVAGTSVQALAAWAERGLPFPAGRVRSGTVDDAEGVAEVLNSVIREGGMMAMDRLVTAAEARDYIRNLSPRARLLVVELGPVIAGFQLIEPLATCTRSMDHVAQVGTHVLAPVRGRGIGRKLAEATFAYCREAGFMKVVAHVRADNTAAQGYYTGLGFRPCGRLVDQIWADGHYIDQILFEGFLKRDV